MTSISTTCTDQVARSNRWPLDANPSTKRMTPEGRILSRGASALSDAELLSLVLRARGTKGSSLRVAEELLQAFDGLAGVLQADDAALEEVHGLDDRGSRAALVAILELAKRAIREQLKARDAFNSPESVKQYLQLHLARRANEAFAVLFLDAQNRMIGMDVMFNGSLTQTSVYPREIVREALHRHAAAVVLAHNHPSGTVQPSRADEALTQTIKSALALVDVRVLDHVIVAPGLSLSMAERGLL